MPSINVIDGAGIHTKPYADIVASLQAAFRAIYGSDVNLDSNTPDGNMIAIFALSQKDFQDLITQDYNSKDPDQAVGAALDGVCALCGIYRKGGTYTEVTIQLVVSQNVILPGIDNSFNPYTVADQNGNQFYLKTVASLIPGTHNLVFRAVNIGAVQVLSNTITVPVTIYPGVDSINNPMGANIEGVDQETDAQLRIRRQRSTSNPSQGFLSGILGNLLRLDGVLGAKVHENNTNDTDADDIPAHSIWVIVDGGTEADIADTIYRYRNAGCGMKGTEVASVTQIDGTTFPIYYDVALEEELYVRFTVAVIGGGAYDADFLKSQMELLSAYEIYQPSDVTTIQALIRRINPQLVITDLEVSSDGAAWNDDLVLPTSKKNKFVLTAENITIL